MYDITPGRRMIIHYPRNRHLRYVDRAPLVPRTIIVRDLIDLVEKPLTPNQLLSRPFLRRGRWLVRTAEEVGNHHQYRQFYLANSAEYRRPGGLRIAVYEPNAKRPKEIISDEFGSTVVERKALIRLVNKLKKEDHGGLKLQIFADDFRLIA